MKKIMCVRCGKKIDSTLEACPFCGHRLKFITKPIIEKKESKKNYTQIHHHGYLTGIHGVKE